jgi:hypothetical protein
VFRGFGSVRWKDGGRDVLGESSQACAKPNISLPVICPNWRKAVKSVKGEDACCDIEELSLMIQRKRRTAVPCQQAALEISCCSEAVVKLRC